jgi:hypothetical protein
MSLGLSVRIACHSSRMHARASPANRPSGQPPRKRLVGQQRELPLTEERPPRSMARAALTSDACKKGEGSEGSSHIPLGDGSRCGLERACAEGGSRGLEGEVAGSQGGQRFLGWITSRSTTPCLIRRRGRSARSGAHSGNQSWHRGVNRDPPGSKPALFGGSLEGGRSGLHTRKCGEARLG